MPPLVRSLARAHVQRTPGLGDEAASVVVARWGARLSALLIRGNGLVVRQASPDLPVPPPEGGGSVAHLPHLLPEGDSAYELLVW